MWRSYMKYSAMAAPAYGAMYCSGAGSSAVATMTVRPDMTNGFDLCHGGLIFTLADTAFAFACNAYDDVTVAGSGTVEFLRPAFEGDVLRAVALEEHRGKRSGVYAVEIVNQRDEKAVAFTLELLVARRPPTEANAEGGN